MHIPKKYFHDRIVLLILSTNTFLALLGTVLILLKLDTARTDSYIVQYRANLGADPFQKGTASALVGFIFFAIFIVVFHTVLSMRVYNLRRHFSIAVLALGTLLLSLMVVVSNALLLLR